MALSLSKGGNISLSKEAPGLTIARIGLGWDARSTDGAPFDLDASALLIGASGRVRSDADFIFYNQLGDVTLPNSKEADPQRASVIHQGDNLTGAGDGDDEQVVVNLAKLPADVQKVVFTVSIHDAGTRGQSFGQVRNAYIRLVNEADGSEVVRYDLSEEAGSETALNFAEVYRHGSEWKFRAIGQGYSTGLEGVARDFGVGV